VSAVVSTVVDVDDEEAEVTGSDGAWLAPLGVSWRQAARVRLFMAEKRRLSLEGKPWPSRPCDSCGWPTTLEESCCRECHRRRKRQERGEREPLLIDACPRLAPAVVARPKRPEPEARNLFEAGGAR
jgi:hypothetical protein